VKESPILFSGSMVRAILAGTKTQTRRIVNPQPIADAMWSGGFYLQSKAVNTALKTFNDARGAPLQGDPTPCPYGAPGDRLWVRESWQSHIGTYGESLVYAYRATDDERAGPWRPSIHMPRAAARITLEVTDVRVERLQAISEADAVAEGIDPVLYRKSAQAGYRDLWEAINGRGTWGNNPWVWVVEFKRVTP
jgi:hypothetical protein